MAIGERGFYIAGCQRQSTHLTRRPADFNLAGQIRVKPADMEEKIVYLTVQISPKGISEVHGGRTVVFISKPDIQSIKLAIGSGAERPVLQVGLGVLLAAVGTCGLIPLCSGNTAVIRYEIGFIFFGLMGVWLIWETLKKQTFL